MSYDTVRDVDPAVADALEGERGRQNDTLAMIARRTTSARRSWRRRAPTDEQVRRGLPRRTLLRRL